MSYSFYLILHLSSLFALILSIGLILTLSSRSRTWGMILHGVASLTSFVAGFGLIAKLSVPMALDIQLRPLVYFALHILTILLYASIYKKALLPSVARFLQKIHPTLYMAPVIASALHFLLQGLVQPEWLAYKFSGWIFLAIATPVLISLSKKSPRQLDIPFMSLVLIYVIVSENIMPVITKSVIGL